MCSYCGYQCVVSCSNSCGAACSAGCTGGCKGTCSSSCGAACTSTCSGGCKGTCSGTCTDSCTGGCFYGCSGGCKGTCSNSCGASCSSGCSGGCTGSCKNSCTAVCANSCTGSCTGGCRNTCSANCSENCSGSCAGGCTGSCTGGCNTTCSAACANSCTGSCQGGCRNTCSASCSEDCTNSCAGGCTGSCTGGCNTTCSAACANSCTGSCQGGCRNTCSASCSEDCTSSCQGGCSTTCNAVCANDCTTTCSGHCSTTCSATCANDCVIQCTETCSGNCSTICSTGCENGCESTCSGQCSTTCSTTCADDCSGGCKTTCNTECTSSCSGLVVSPLGSANINSLPTQVTKGTSVTISGDWPNAHHTAISVNGGDWTNHNGENFTRTILLDEVRQYTISVSARNTPTSSDYGTESQTENRTITVTETQGNPVVTVVNIGENTITWRVENGNGKDAKVYLSNAIFGPVVYQVASLSNSQNIIVSNLSSDTEYTIVVDGSMSYSSKVRTLKSSSNFDSVIEGHLEHLVNRVVEWMISTNSTVNGEQTKKEILCQFLLKALNRYSGSYGPYTKFKGVDGDFGTNSKNALRSFKTEFNLGNDDTINEATINLLKVKAFVVLKDWETIWANKISTTTSMLSKSYELVNPIYYVNFNWAASDPANMDEIDPIFLSRLARYAKFKSKLYHFHEGFRDYARQKDLLDQYGYPNADWPGLSRHNWMLAVDIDPVCSNFKEKYKNDAYSNQTDFTDYGFHKPLTSGNGGTLYEDWHLEPVETYDVVNSRKKSSGELCEYYYKLNYGAVPASIIQKVKDRAITARANLRDTGTTDIMLKPEVILVEACLNELGKDLGTLHEDGVDGRYTIETQNALQEYINAHSTLELSDMGYPITDEKITSNIELIKELIKSVSN